MDIKNLSRYILIALVLIATISLIWNHSENTQNESDKVDGVPEADAYIIQGVQTSYDITGRITSIIKSKKMEHFPEPMPGLLVEPDINLFAPDTVYSSSTPTWHITANKGSFDIQNEKLTLEDKVIAIRPEDTGKPLKMETAILHFDNKTQLINTDAMVKITNQTSEITSIGMNIHLDKKIIELNAKVRGIYVPSSE